MRPRGTVKDNPLITAVKGTLANPPLRRESFFLPRLDSHIQLFRARQQIHIITPTIATRAVFIPTSMN